MVFGGWGCDLVTFCYIKKFEASLGYMKLSQNKTTTKQNRTTKTQKTKRFSDLIGKSLVFYDNSVKAHCTQVR